MNTEVSERLRFQHAHTRIAAFIFRSRSAGSRSPVNTQIVFTSCCSRKSTVPLGFCSGGFSSTAGYVPAPRLNIRRRERHGTQTADQVRWALPVFIRITGKTFRSFPQAFRLRPWRQSSGFPLLLLSNDASPHPFHLQVPVKTPVSNFDCVMDSTRGNFSVKYKIL
jgi:hypothetical protein